MTEYVSKCCGAVPLRAKPWLLRGADRLFNHICSKCNKPCEIVVKEVADERK